MRFEHPSWTIGGWRDRGDEASWVLDPLGVVAHDPLLDRPVLVTAFGPFPGQPVNPSELIVDSLAGDEDVVGHVLDVSYERAPAMLDRLVRMVRPSAVVCFGVASDATAVRVETAAGKRDRSYRSDVDGDVGRGRRIDTGPETIRTRLDVEAIVDALEGVGVPVERSDDAGGYVCNRLFRHVLTSVDLLDVPAGLVHVPRLGAPAFDATAVALAGRVVVSAVVAGVLDGSASR